MSKTFLQIQTSVLTRLGMPDDGATNPTMVDVIKEAINGSLAELSLEFDWLHKQARAIVNWTAGTAQQALPSGVRPERIRQVNYRTATITYPLTPGIYVEDENRYNGVPVNWRAMYEHQATGVAASDPDAAVILLEPTPSDAGELWIDYQTEEVELSDDADVVGGDTDLLVLMAAAEVSSHYASHLTDMLLGKAARMMSKLKARSVTRRDMHLGPPRRLRSGVLRRYLRSY